MPMDGIREKYAYNIASVPIHIGLVNGLRPKFKAQCDWQGVFSQYLTQGFKLVEIFMDHTQTVQVHAACFVFFFNNIICSTPLTSAVLSFLSILISVIFLCFFSFIVRSLLLSLPFNIFCLIFLFHSFSCLVTACYITYKSDNRHHHHHYPQLPDCYNYHHILMFAISLQCTNMVAQLKNKLICEIHLFLYSQRDFLLMLFRTQCGSLRNQHR